MSIGLRLPGAAILGLYNLIPIKIYRTVITLIGAMKNRNMEISKERGMNVYFNEHTDNSSMAFPKSSFAYTIPNWMACKKIENVNER